MHILGLVCAALTSAHEGAVHAIGKNDRDNAGMHTSTAEGQQRMQPSGAVARCAHLRLPMSLTM